MTLARATPERRGLRVRGQVQGVGFRPYVYRLARELELTGWVRNDGQGVAIEVQGRQAGLDAFVERMRDEPPRLACVEQVEVEAIAPAREQGFSIIASAPGTVDTGITPDAATCPDCLRELLDPRDRRYRYPFINCTHCGPRYTITSRVPYDRPGTSMAPFRLCADCAREYADPRDRRFHAEPNACARCGPRLALLDAAGRPLSPRDPIADTVRRLLSGEIVAVKGLGGFHLACDARNAAAVARLRDRKHREAKPLAVMLASAASIRGAANLDDDARVLLESPARPIVLLAKRGGCEERFPGVAPGVGRLGVMLPYTPVHYLLFHEAAGRPLDPGWLDDGREHAFVMTSANPPGEPLVTDDEDALQRLCGIADAYLTHDRAIVERADDSVVRATPSGPAYIRRARGYVPRAIPLPAAGPSVLAVGGWLKSTVCVTRGGRAYLSAHIGDLDSVAARHAHAHAAHHLLDVLEVEPVLVAHDLHPDYASTGFAARIADEREIARVGVQHHHAHIAAVAAEHGMEGPVLGLALDGVGLGDDGGAWGGELLRVGDGCERLGHLRPLALPGGDRAAREPWRMAASALHALGRGAEIDARFPDRPARAVRDMLDREFACPLTSSAGRLFDAAAALLGVAERSRYEAEAAMALEALAARHGPVPPMIDGYALVAGGLDPLPLLARLADIADLEFGAALFHATLADGLAAWAAEAAGRIDERRVAVGGGCASNAVLTDGLRAALARRGLSMIEARALPPNDGALSYGQAWVALCAARTATGRG